MKWSWKLGRIAGIKIQVHWTFSILIAWIVLMHALHGADALRVVLGVLLVLAVFACVVLHELGHALTARRFGISTRDITLLPIGGVARLERMPDDPKQELLVAVAGPAVNAVIAGLLFGGLAAAGAMRPASDVAVVGGNVAVQLMWINVFNLLPAFPMDGGRVLRALLAYRLDYVAATRVAAGVGQGMAVLFGLIGLFSNPFLVFIAIFVYLGAQAEAQHVETRSALEGVTAGDAMMTEFRSLHADDRLTRAIDELLAGAQQDFPVLKDERLVGLLARNDLVKALKERRGDAAVGDVMNRECFAVAVDEPLHRALSQMRSERSATLPVVRDGSLVGILTLENVGELMMVNSALDGGERGGIAKVFATD
jgi:Zn-dependent protease/predicted transcriptional regulator